MAAGTLSTEDLRQEVEKLRLEVEGKERERSNPAFSPPRIEPSVGTRVLNYTNEDRYEGDTVDDMRHGEGHHICSNGDEYTGRWQYDKRDGKGKAVFKRGVTYDGEWKEDRAHGVGTCVYENGARYEGDFQHDQRSGWGLFEVPNGQTYEGEWERDTIHGNGRWTYEDGSYYEGSYSNGERICGKFISADGEMEYEGDGEWRSDCREGQGTLTSSAGYSYKGEWRRDKPHGKGVCRYDNGDWYAGDFASGVREGEGRCVFANGEKYVGDWSNDQRHGNGKSKFPSGEKYKDGTAFRGQWEKDCWVQTSADPKFTIAAGAGLRRATAGRRACFQIEARDENNNRRLSGGDDIKVVLKNAKQELSFAEVKDQEDGTYGASYIETVSGDLRLCIVTGDGEMVGESPYSIVISPATPSGKHSTVEGENARQAACNKDEAFTLTIRDQYGNVCPQKLEGSGIGPEVELSSSEGPCPVSISRKEDGRFNCAYRPLFPGLYRLAILLHGKHIAGTPLSIAVSSASEECNLHSIQPTTPVTDKVSMWGDIAREEYAKDGASDGWDSDAENDVETPETKFMKAHPDVPVVENLEDLWRLSKLQQERKKMGRDGTGK
ncbi:hypothetical protein BSKO_12108 [Bryopsis sp. KO-2023]|nr:hypothetical protein BSKO_12108 [Bryopsis sp. KO-2023]